MTRIDVAIAIVVCNGVVLVCQRRAGGAFGGYWEFPGGKCAPGESPEQCVGRELREEVGIDVEPVQAMTPLNYDYADVAVRLHPFFCRWTAGEPRPLECQQFEWAEPRRLGAYQFPAANAALVDEVIATVPHLVDLTAPRSNRQSI